MVLSLMDGRESSKPLAVERLGVHLLETGWFVSVGIRTGL